MGGSRTSDDPLRRRPYEPPSIQTEAAFEVLVAGCTWMDPSWWIECDPDFGGYVWEDF